MDVPLGLTIEGRALGGRGERSGAGDARAFWRDLEEWAARESGAEAPSFERGEFAPGVDEAPDGVSRRTFMRIMGASMALAGMYGCQRQPPEKIVAYVEEPEKLLPGTPVSYATATVLAGYARGAIVTTNEGRPTKVEGHPEHPDSLGATSVFDQASVLDLYDPDRSQSVRHLGEVTTWQRFFPMWEDLDAKAGGDGRGFALLTGNVTSPTLLKQIHAWLERRPGARWYVHEPTLGPGATRGVRTIYDVPKAKVIVALDCDLLNDGPGHVRYAMDFADGRRVRADRTAMNRLYAAEPMATITGAKADERVSVAPSRMGVVARALVDRVRGAGSAQGLTEAEAAWVDAAVVDLRAHEGASIIAAGATQSAEVHALVRAANEALGNLGASVREIEAFDGAADPKAGTLEDLAADASSIKTLVILDCNAVHTAPADLDIVERLDAIPLRIHHGLHVDETARRCHWHLPATHTFEMWSDARAYDGTTTIIQPMILPLYDGLSAHELLAGMDGVENPDGHAILRAAWQKRVGRSDEGFELWWRRALHDGIVPDSAAPASGKGGGRGDGNGGRSSAPAGAGTSTGASGAEGRTEGDVEVCIRPDPRIFDGRFANNAWLQELPKPISMLTWDNAALMNPALASRLGVESEQEIEIGVGERRVTAPVWIVPGVADDTVVVHLGYGRPFGGRVAQGAGFDAYPLVTSDSPWRVGSASVRALGTRRLLSTTQNHQRMEGRDLLRSAPIDVFRDDPHAVAGPHPGNPDETLMPRGKYESGSYQWGMSIDLTACIGCGVCTVACQAENNIPAVGRREVRRGREMHWIRVDRYYEGSPSDPTIHHQPVPCMHCEHAPCEVVCPTGATQHSTEGLNEMIYNRCVGTRYCSNNCPYKVRRFNFFDYVPAHQQAPVQKMWRNPNVTVRSRGVMEKCSYCVQRIESARIDAMKEGRRIGGDEVVPACAAACPTRAIVFGDLQQESEVAALKKEPHDYGMLTELNTYPRTTYLVELRNPSGVHAPTEGGEAS